MMDSVERASLRGFPKTSVMALWLVRGPLRLPQMGQEDPLVKMVSSGATPNAGRPQPHTSCFTELFDPIDAILIPSPGCLVLCFQCIIIL